MNWPDHLDKSSFNVTKIFNKDLTTLFGQYDIWKFKLIERMPEKVKVVLENKERFIFMKSM